MAIYEWALNAAKAYRFWQNLASRRFNCDAASGAGQLANAIHVLQAREIGG
jgi:hypothetical protein